MYVVLEDVILFSVRIYSPLTSNYIVVIERKSSLELGGVGLVDVAFSKLKKTLGGITYI